MVTRVNVRNGERGMFNPAVVRDRGGERAGEQLWVYRRCDSCVSNFLSPDQA